MTQSGLAQEEKMLTMDDDVERRRAVEELERMEESIKFEAEASVERADAEGNEDCAVAAAETAARAEEIREATEGMLND